MDEGVGLWAVERAAEVLGDSCCDADGVGAVADFADGDDGGVLPGGDAGVVVHELCVVLREKVVDEAGLEDEGGAMTSCVKRANKLIFPSHFSFTGGADGFVIGMSGAMSL